MANLRYILQIIISIYLALSITGCSDNVEYTPPSNSTETAITHYSFGKMVIDGKDHNGDISISPDDKIRGWSFDYNSHIIDDWNFKKLIGSDVKTLIIGTGYNGAASLSTLATELIEQLKAKGIQVQVMTTSDAVRLFNKISKEGVLACFHLNC